VITLTKYIEPADQTLRLGMPRGAYHARAATEIETNFAKRYAHPVDGRLYYVEVCCPDCGVHLMLSRENHTVAQDGTVSPSLVCSNTRDGCAWHVFARLEGWPPSSDER
jgi:hypothetical protein